MSYLKPEQVAEYTIESGVKKATMPIQAILALGYVAGAFIALGFLLDIRVIASIPNEWGSIANFIGASVFPVGLILVLIGGGELLTGNMMAVPFARLAGRITTWQMFYNLALVTVSNFMGAIFVAYCFGHVVGLTETGDFLTKTVDLVQHKLDDSFLQSFLSGIGCNWLVAMAVWLSYSAKDISGKIMGIWFPTMAFVAIGFQHVVANMFLIPAAIFAGHFTWVEYLGNFAPVWLGNLTGGALFVAGIYYMAYLKKINEEAAESAVQTSDPAPIATVSSTRRQSLLKFNIKLNFRKPPKPHR